jgi:hypothetical protein
MRACKVSWPHARGAVWMMPASVFTSINCARRTRQGPVITLSASSTTM